MSKPVLSVYILARNEERNIARAIQSVREIADELIVADTGSTDQTIQLATETGAKVCHFPWCDDFAAARNYALDQLRGEWIFWIDADEELLEESIPRIRECISKDNALGYFVVRRDLTDVQRPEEYTQMWQFRLFRRLPELRYRGKCHADFHPPIEQIADRNHLQVYPSDIAIRHYGYVAEWKEPKLKRAARLLELELAERPGQLYYLIEYGRTLFLLKDSRAERILTEAAEVMLHHQDEAEPPTPMAAALLEYLMQLPARRLPGGLKPEKVEELAERWFPGAVPLLWVKAQKAFSNNEYALSEQILRRVIHLGEEKQYDPYISFNPRLIGDDAKLNLGVCLVRQARLEEAEAVFREILKRPERQKEARKNLEVIQSLRGTASPRRFGKSEKRR